MPVDESWFHLRASADRLAVLLDCRLEEGQLKDLVGRIEGGLKALNIPNPPPREELETMLQSAFDERSSITRLKLVEGTPMTPPKNGIIEWAGEFFSSGFAIDGETGAVDYRQRRAHPSVQQGDLLATLTHPVEGADGRDVFGKKIPAPRARPARLRAGGGVTVDETGLRYYAATKGHVRYLKGTLSVDKVYYVRGSVGLATGHISHPGALAVQGDVEAGSRIKADGDIWVGGLVEGADIEGGGGLEVRGGITRFRTTPITVAGTVTARYLLETHVAAGSDVVAVREIRQSQIQSQGTVNVSRGRIVGGSVYAQHAIDTMQAGSEGEVPTTLTVGCIGEMARTVAEKEKELTKLQENSEKIRAIVDPLVCKANTLSHSKSETLAQLLNELARIEDAIRELETELRQIHGGRRPEIIVREVIFPETTWNIGYATLRIREPLKGPVRAVASRGKIHLTAWRR